MEKARLVLDKAFQEGEIDPHIYSSFIENAVNIVPNGLYNPQHPQADDKGFRKDVTQLIRELKTPAIRFPGGNYVSNYDWVDGIGPRESRPVRNNVVHGTIDENLVGIDDFVDFSQRAGTEFMIAVNLGTGSIREAENEVEYCNVAGGTYWSDLRRKNGHEAPHNLKFWYLGNEMDGFWQVCQHTPETYAQKAREAAKVMKMVDPSIQLIICGSSAVELGTYPEWDRIVLERTYPYVDLLSLHKYYFYDAKVNSELGSPFTVEDLAYFPIDFEKMLKTAEGTIDYVKAKLRTDKEVYISVDEWGLNSSTDVTPGKDLNWTERVYPVNQENVYPFGNLIDALIYGMFLISFMNHSSRVKHACRSLLRYTTMTADPNGIALRHTPYYVMQEMAEFGRGVALKNALQSPLTETEHHGKVPAVFSSASYDEAAGTVTIFAVNLSLREDIAFEPEFRGFGELKLEEHLRLFDEQPLAGNTFENPMRLVPETIPIGDKLVLRKHSWNVLRYTILK